MSKSLADQFKPQLFTAIRTVLDSSLDLDLIIEGKTDEAMDQVTMLIQNQAIQETLGPANIMILDSIMMSTTIHLKKAFMLIDAIKSQCDDVDAIKSAIGEPGYAAYKDRMDDLDHGILDAKRDILNWIENGEEVSDARLHQRYVEACPGGEEQLLAIQKSLMKDLAKMFKKTGMPVPDFMQNSEGAESIAGQMPDHVFSDFPGITAQMFQKKQEVPSPGVTGLLDESMWEQPRKRNSDES